MGSESTLVWAPLKRSLDARRLQYQRIEDKSCPGIPDLNVHIPGFGDCWIELKFTTYQKHQKTIEIGLRPEQFIWLRNGKKAGRNCYLLVRVDDSWCMWSDIDDWQKCKAPASPDIFESAIKFDCPDDVVRFLIAKNQPQPV